MRTFQLEMRELYKTADVHSNLLVSWELVTEGYQGKPVKYTHFKLKCGYFERCLPDMIIFCFVSFWWNYIPQIVNQNVKSARVPQGCSWCCIQSGFKTHGYNHSKFDTKVPVVTSDRRNEDTDTKDEDRLLICAPHLETSLPAEFGWLFNGPHEKHAKCTLKAQVELPHVMTFRIRQTWQ